MQSWITSTNENPLCLIAVSIVFWVWSMSRALHLATKVALAESERWIGLRGWLNSPRGSDFVLNPSWLVGVAWPVVSEND